MNRHRYADEWMEQAAIERRDRAGRVARIRAAAIDNPWMPICLLAERFGETNAAIEHVLKAAGIRRERE